MEYAVIDDSKKKEQKQQNVSCNQNQVNLHLLSLHCQFWVESSVHVQGFFVFNGVVM